MPTLEEQLLTDEIKPKLAQDCCDLIDAEVARKKGFKGVALRAGLKTVKAFRPGFVYGVVLTLSPKWVGKLEPEYAEYLAAGHSYSFGEHIGRIPEVVSEKLLEVTDERAEKTKFNTIRKIYLKLRPNAKEHVHEALPGLGRIVDKYL